MNIFTNFGRMGYLWALMDSWDHHIYLSTKWALCDENQVHNQARIINNDRLLTYIYIYRCHE